MRTDTFVARVLADCKAFMHHTRWQRLFDLCSSALNGQAISLTQLALGSGSKTTLRHRVKAVGRLLGNPAFASEHLDVYRTLAARWLTATPAAKYTSTATQGNSPLRRVSRGSCRARWALRT